MRARGKTYPVQKVHKPGCDACSDNVHKEVADSKKPGVGVLQALLSQRFNDTGLVFGSSCRQTNHVRANLNT